MNEEPIRNTAADAAAAKQAHREYARSMEGAIIAMHADLVEILNGERDPELFHIDSDPHDQYGYYGYHELFERYYRTALIWHELDAEEQEVQREAIDKRRDAHIRQGRGSLKRFEQLVDEAIARGVPVDDVVTCPWCGAFAFPDERCRHCGRLPGAVLLDGLRRAVQTVREEQVEQERFARLTEEAGRWREAEELRRYAREALLVLDRTEGTGSSKEERRADLLWALEYADRADPLRPH